MSSQRTDAMGSDYKVARAKDRRKPASLRGDDPGWGHPRTNEPPEEVLLSILPNSSALLCNGHNLPDFLHILLQAPVHKLVPQKANFVSFQVSIMRVRVCEAVLL